jgi:hypothetical protein
MIGFGGTALIGGIAGLAGAFGWYGGFGAGIGAGGWTAGGTLAAGSSLGSFFAISVVGAAGFGDATGVEAGVGAGVEAGVSAGNAVISFSRNGILIRAIAGLPPFVSTYNPSSVVSISATILLKLSRVSVSGTIRSIGTLIPPICLFSVPTVEGDCQLKTGVSDGFYRRHSSRILAHI